MSSPRRAMACALGEAIDMPRVAPKLCGGEAELLALLPPRWRIASMPGTVVMLRDHAPSLPVVAPSGFAMTVARQGAVSSARIAADGAIVASGYGAEAAGVFIYDRILVDERFRRRGLGRALLAALASTRRSPASREILTATAAGAALYRTTGWRDHSPYCTAMIPAA